MESTTNAGSFSGCRSAVSIHAAQSQASMRFDADWMSRADDRILEYLSEAGPESPKAMVESDRVRFSRQYVNARCQKLVSYGLVIHLGNGVYDITRKGEQYLEGELDAAELDPS